MKKILIYSVLSLFLISSCRKSDNANVPEFTKVPVPTLKKDASKDLTISVQDPAAFSAAFNVALFFPNAEKPSKFDVVIRKNENSKNVKLFKADVTTYPTDFNVTGPELIALFGEIVLGDKFDIGVNMTTTDGKVYEAFPAVGIPYSSGISNTGASPSIRYEAVCKYISEDYAGNFKVTVDEWNDFGKGATVVVTVLNDHQVSFLSPVSGQPIVVDINTTTNETSIAKQPYGDYKAAGIDPTWTYGVASAESVASANNFVAPCDLILSMQIKYTVAAGNFGDYTLTLQKSSL